MSSPCCCCCFNAHCKNKNKTKNIQRQNPKLDSSLHPPSEGSGNFKENFKRGFSDSWVQGGSGGAPLKGPQVHVPRRSQRPPRGCISAQELRVSTFKCLLSCKCLKSCQKLPRGGRVAGEESRRERRGRGKGESSETGHEPPTGGPALGRPQRPGLVSQSPAPSLGGLGEQGPWGPRVLTSTQRSVSKGPPGPEILPQV